MYYKIFAFVLICCQSYARFSGIGIEDFDSVKEPGYFPNKVDHFDPSNNETFGHRYWPGDYICNDDKPLFIYICGESAGRDVLDGSLVRVLAKEFGGTVVVLEHRFYGESFPKRDLSLSNLKTLSHDQALEDIASFIKYLKDVKRLGDNKVFTVGGSYAGALSAWARYKFPHLIAGALSSSGVVNAVLDFYQFDEQVQRVVRNRSPSCEQIIRELLDEAKHMWEVDPWKLKSAHKAFYFEWEDFAFYYSDIFVETVQYGRGTELCKKMEEIKNAPDRQEQLAKLAKENRAEPHQYAFQFIRNTHASASHSYRQWTYQYCSSLAYFNSVGPQSNPLRFKDMDLNYWQTYCEKSFGTKVYPNTVHTNSLYGGVKIADVASRIIFTNAGDDPWQWAGIRE